MKKLLTWISLLCVSFNFIFASQKIIMVDETKSVRLIQTDIEELGGKIVRELPLINAVVVEFPQNIKDSQIYSLSYVKKVEDDLYIKWIEEYSLIELPSVEDVKYKIKNEEYKNELPPVYYLVDKELNEDELKEIPWGVKRVNAHKAWFFSTGKGVNVGVVDTGIDYTHPDLSPLYKGGYNAIDASKPPLDDQGHGTHVAGIIAAVKDGKGVVGVAPEVNLYSIKVLDSNGSGKFSWIVAGIEWAVKNGIKVINMSLGSRYPSDAIKAAVEAAYKAGLIIVCAAGNDGGAVNYPAAYPQSIAVSASDINDKIASFSSRGSQIAFIAPGVNIYSTYKGGGYKTLSGTSMASPHVAGLAALVVGIGVEDPSYVKEVLSRAARKLPNLKDIEQGYGMIDASNIKK